jgi:ubiquitin-protein ligase
MSAVRLRRLQADFQKLSDYVRRHPRLQLIQTAGDPPERYQIEFQVRGLRQKGDEFVEVESHLVEIALPLSYPRLPPQCRMLTPVFHPNIAPHAICIGDHWSPGEPLASIVQRIGEMLAFQSYNTKSPLNGEAARWANEHLDRLPLDPVSMLIDEASPAPAPASPPSPAGPSEPSPSPPPAPAPVDTSPSPEPEPEALASAEPTTIVCSGCGHRLRISPALVGKKFRCPKCQTVQVYPGS